MAHAVPQDNPGLAPFDISDYEGISGTNFYESDALLKRIVAHYSKGYEPEHQKDMEAHLSRYGELCGGILNELTIACHKEGKYGEIVHFDRTGKRIDRIDYSPEQRESRRISYEHGIVNLDFHKDWKHPFTMLHKMALAYLANQNGEGGMTCPLAMTDGMIEALRKIGTPRQQEKYLPLVAGEKSESHFMCGQYVTERVGGSNVAQNRTVARRAENGKWILNGEKWFCSNPGDLWVTTARVEGTSTIGLFLVPRTKENGELNGCYHLRKKDIIGSRGKITVEAVYQDLEAEELGRPTHGLANLIRYVIQKSRIHVAVSAVGMSRRAFAEALAYVSVREAYGKKVIEFPIVRRTLAEMQARHVAVTWAAFRNFDLINKNNNANLFLTPLLKYISTVHATWITHEAMILHGGNGILGDFSVLPRLHNDSIINETWEGTHHIITEHALKAILRPKVRRAFFSLIDENMESAQKAGIAKALLPADLLADLPGQLESLRNECEKMLGENSAWLDLNRVHLCDRFYALFALSELCANASDPLLGAAAAAFGEYLKKGSMGPVSDGSPLSDASVQKVLLGK